jgi:hypothetical protein
MLCKNELKCENQIVRPLCEFWMNAEVIKISNDFILYLVEVCEVFFFAGRCDRERGCQRF